MTISIVKTFFGKAAQCVVVVVKLHHFSISAVARTGGDGGTRGFEHDAISHGTGAFVAPAISQRDVCSFVKQYNGNSEASDKHVGSHANNIALKSG